MTEYNTLYDILNDEDLYGDDDAVIIEIKEYFCKLLEPYIGDDFRAAERTIRNAE